MTQHAPLAADEFREQTVEILDRLTERCATLELSEPPEALAMLMRKLAEDEHRVLVLGEVKRGKSSFVNALLGTNLLPTSEEVATCQPFCVRARDEGGYRLRFEDGSARQIALDELAAYGSQVQVDRGEAADLEAPLRWIEVDVPARFLPDRVALLDLPGLGAVNAGHAEITRRFVPLADAVIFVLDAGQPLGGREVELLASLLEVTSRIFFIQTKIDQHSREFWEQTLRRNEAILAERFGGRLRDTRVWPVSSANLLAAASAGDNDADALLFVSRYRELAASLHEFLADVCAAPRAVAALMLAARHHQACHRVLDARLQSLSDLSARQAAAHREAVAGHRSAFQDAWGQTGHERSALLKSIRRIANLSKQQLRESLQASGPIAVEMKRRIDAIDSVEQANELGTTIGADIVAAAMDEWQRICQLATEQYAELLEPLLEASDALMPEFEPIEIGVPEHDGPAARADDSLYDRIRGTFGYSMPMYVGAGLAVSIVATPLAMIAAAGGLLWAGTKGWKQTATQRTKAAKADLQRHMHSVLQTVANHFLMVDLSSGRYSRADEHFSAMEAGMTEHVDAFVRRRVEDLRRELARLEAQEQLRAEERDAARQALQAVLTEWDAIGQNLVRLLGDERSRPHVAALTRAESADATAPLPETAVAAAPT
jgi:ribosome biogenesis GTPase A